MGKLRVLSGREACQILEAEGFIEVRQRGSHIVMQKRSGNTTIDDQMTVLANPIVDDTFPDEALNHRDIEQTARPCSATSDAAD